MSLTGVSGKFSLRWNLPKSSSIFRGSNLPLDPNSQIIENNFNNSKSRDLVEGVKSLMKGDTLVLTNQREEAFEIDSYRPYQDSANNRFYEVQVWRVVLIWS